MRINEASELLNSVYIDWSHILANPRGIRKDHQITWANRVPKMLKKPVMISDVIDMADSGQYTFQIAKDGSIIQIYYQYNPRGNEIQSACLAFYSTAVYKEKVSPTFQAESVVKLKGEDIFGEDILYEEALERENEQIPPSNDKSAHWLRIDYDPQHAIGVLHHDCHMHLSAFPHARLVVAGVPNPKQFVEFIMALCYPQAYERHRLDENGQYVAEEHIWAVNSKYVPLLDHKVFRQIAHFRIPNSMLPESHQR